MAKRPSLADSLMASLNKGIHVDTAEKIARGFVSIPAEGAPSPALLVESVTVAVLDPIVSPVIVKTAPVLVSTPVIVKPKIDTPKEVTPSDRLSVSPLDGQTVKLLNRDTVIPLNSHTVRQIDTKTVTPPNPQTVSYSKTLPQTPIQYVPLDVLNLAYNQACILECLINNISGITNARAISDATHITIPSVREALQRLIVKGFIHKPITVKNAAFQGFSYILNKSLCDHFINAGGLGQENYRRPETVPKTVSESDGHTVTHPDGLTVHSSSKSFLQNQNLTTTSDHQTVLPSNGGTITPLDPDTLIPSDGVTRTPSNGFILTGSVGAYWEEEGLGEGQAQKWCSQFEVAPDQMKQQLDWARFDLETNGRRAEVKKDTVSWFFGHLRTTGGCFPRPINYKSPIELRAEAFQLQQDQDKAAKSLLVVAEFETNFQAFLADPESSLYQELLKQLSGFAAEQLKDGERQAAEIELRDLFKRQVQARSM